MTPESRKAVEELMSAAGQLHAASVGSSDDEISARLRVRLALLGLRSLLEEKETRLEDAYAEGRRDEQEELASVLPGTTYMDPPDGGAPTILEQLQRQAKDAKRYLWLRHRWNFIGWIGGAYRKRDEDELLPVCQSDSSGLDAAIDAAMSPGSQVEAEPSMQAGGERQGNAGVPGDGNTGDAAQQQGNGGKA